MAKGCQVLSTNLVSSSECVTAYDQELDTLDVQLSNPPTVDKDTKFMFHCTSKGVWLHTLFVTDMQERMTREQLDNPHKEKTWKVWRENFSVEIIFDEPANTN